MAIFGSRTSRPVHWLQTGLGEARRVARIHDQAGQPVGTGFVFDGELLAPAFAGLPLFLTTNHCIAGARPGPGVPFAEAAVFFQEMGDLPSRGEAAFLQSLSESEIAQLNYTLLLLDRWPGPVGSLKAAPQPPSADGKVYVVSYPQGGGLTIALDDNVVVPQAAEVPKLARPEILQYRAPTEPGSSGGPVFNEHWEIAAMHIGRVASVANYGVLFEQVLANARANLTGMTIPMVTRDAIARHENVSPPNLQEASSYFSVFISYRHEDAVFARRLHNAFASAGVRVWIDEVKMVAGEFIDQAIQRGIAASDRFVLCCSKASLENSWWVDSEVTSIFDKERQLAQDSGRKQSVVIPVLLDDYLTSGWKGAKAPELRSRLAADFRRWQDDERFAAAFERLLRALRTEAV